MPRASSGRRRERIESLFASLGEAVSGELFLSALRRDLMPQGEELQDGDERVREGCETGAIEAGSRNVGVGGQHVFNEGRSG